MSLNISGGTSAPLTPAQLLLFISLVDGFGSGLDADYVRGLDQVGFRPGLNIGGTPTYGQVFPRAAPTGLGAIRFSTLR